MATTVYFDNKQVILPGAYSNIVSGERNPARNLDYGKVLVILIRCFILILIMLMQ